MKKIINHTFKALRKKHIVIMGILFICISAAGFFIPRLVSHNLAERGDLASLQFEVGEISDRNVIAKSRFQFVNKTATEKAVNEELSGIDPVFIIDTDLTLQYLAEFNSFIDGFSGMSMEEMQDAVDAFTRYKDSEIPWDSIRKYINDKPADVVHQTAETARDLINDIFRNGIFTREDLQAVPDILSDTISVSYKQQIWPEEPLVRKIGISDIFIMDFREQLLALWVMEGEPDDFAIRQFATDLVIPFIQPNGEYDYLKTAQLMQEAENGIEPVVTVIEEGEYIIMKDYLVTQEAYEKLSFILQDELDMTPGRMAGYTLYSLILTAVFFLVLLIRLPRNFRFLQFFYISVSAAVIYYLFLYLIATLMLRIPISRFAFGVPIAFFAMMITAVSGKETGYIISLFLSLVIFLLPQAEYSAFIFLAIHGILGTRIISRATRRIDIIKSFIYLTVYGVAVMIIIGMMQDFSLGEYYLYALLVGANSLVSSILLVMLLPVFENLFNLPTDFCLLELTTMNTKILKRMAVVARGTYSHSVAVADLAEYACEAIGANSLLARVGAYYHDIGKIDQPEYFIENQTGDNKHDELKPSLSAAVIKSHVKVGIEKAKEIGLPQEVIDILAQHHGSDLISYFYMEAVNKNEKNSKISPEDFSYNGVLPMTKEAAVVMLADSVDAASRTIKQPTTPKLEKLVWKIIMDKINNKQLTNCDLSLSDLEEVKKQFILMLSGRYHTRIEYPEVPDGVKG